MSRADPIRDAARPDVATALPRPDRPLLALAWMLGAVASFTLMAVAGRAAQIALNVFEVMLYRSIIGLAIVLVLIRLAGRGFGPAIRTRHWRDHAWRNVFHFAGQNLWFYALALIPLAQLTALEFTNPLWVAVLAPLMLGERLSRVKVAAFLIGFVGILLVARPGAAPIEIGHAAGLGAAIAFAFNTLFTKRIMAHDGVLCVLFWMSASQIAMAFALALPFGITWPAAQTWPWVIVIGIAGLTAHYCLTTALGHAPATIVAPMEFIRLPVIALVGALVYAEAVSIWVFVGALVIIGANILNMRGSRAG